MPIDATLVPDTDDAVEMYQSHGGHIICKNQFGHDPLGTREDLMKLERKEFMTNTPALNQFFIL